MALQGKPKTVAELFRPHWSVWKCLGQVPHHKYPKLYKLYAILLNICFSIGYPLHLLLGLLNSLTLEEMFLNLTISVPVAVCSLKFFNIWRNLYKVRQLEKMFNTLYARINQRDEWTYYREVTIPNALKVLYLFYFICLGTAVTSELTLLLMGFAHEWRLMYPAYFPFDPYATTGNYVLAHLYQIIGLLVQLAENLVSDTYGGMCLALLAGHAHLLGKRVARIGYDASKTCEENNRALVDCIADHNMLFDCHRAIGEIIGVGMFVQIISASLIMGIVIIYMVFYVNNAFEFVYYGIYLFGCTMEVFPTCYFGTYFEIEFDQLTHMLFSCNWMDQGREFNKNLRICVEQSLRKRSFRVGGMFHINLNTFFATCKGAYSLLALALSMK
ncbi:PREDICTED: odorant receptor 33b-like [Rhagoletis zephyria]|uniref:odorant receptor 33b-like n=1 Tax=Rhagoletis zephyria TaxID=28612 RepID=UPI0008119F5A|nr:PREDICTED: odorant receptor 33b-like [Rhagoletis zephyria]